MPAIETATMPKVAGMARSCVPACTARHRGYWHGATFGVIQIRALSQVFHCRN